MYTGEWKKGKREGSGSQEYANGDHFDGEWKDDMPHGWGNLTGISLHLIFDTVAEWSSSVLFYPYSTPIVQVGKVTIMWESGKWDRGTEWAHRSF